VTKLEGTVRCRGMHILPVPLRRTSKFCYGLLRTVTFRCVYSVLLRHRDCRGRFFDSLKICPGIHGNHGLSRLLIPSPCVVSCPPRFGHGALKRDCRGCRDPSVNVALVRNSNFRHILRRFRARTRFMCYLPHLPHSYSTLILGVFPLHQIAHVGPQPEQRP